MGKSSSFYVCSSTKIETYFFYSRLAMIAIGGMVAGAAVSGNGFPYLA